MARRQSLPPHGRCFLVTMLTLAIILAPAHAVAGEQQQRIDEFMSWLRGNGATVDALEVFPSEHGFGVRATRAIALSEMFVVIPRNVTLNEGKGLQHPVVSAVLADLDPRLATGLLLQISRCVGGQ